MTDQFSFSSLLTRVSCVRHNMGFHLSMWYVPQYGLQRSGKRDALGFHAKDYAVAPPAQQKGVNLFFELAALREVVQLGVLCCYTTISFSI